MKEKVNRFAVFKGIRVHVKWKDQGMYRVHAVCSSPLADDFFSNMKRPGRLEYEGDIPVESKDLVFEND